MKLGAMAKGAPLEDVYGYLTNLANGSFVHESGMEGGGEAGMGSTGAGVWLDTPTNQAEGSNATPTLRLDVPNQALRDAVQLVRDGSGDGQGGYRFEVDASLLPQTRFGGVDMTAQVNPHTRLRNPNLVYDDPNYGRITDHRNVDTSSISDYFGPAAMALATWGMGALGAPTLAMQGLQLGRGALSGNGIDIGRIISMIAPYLNIPGEVVTLGRLAAGFADRNGRG